MSNRLRPAIAVAVVALFTVPALAACGGGGGSGGVASLGGASGSDGDGTTTTAGEDPEDAALAFVRCMREHGVDMPDPSEGGGIRLTVRPGNKRKVDAAQKACQPLLQAARPKLTPEQQTVMQDAALAFAKCMREHGVDMPDPTFGADGGMTMLKRSKGGTGLDPDDPKFKAAQKACMPIVEEAARKAGLPQPEQRMNRSGGADS